MSAVALDHIPAERIAWRPHPGSQAIFLACPIWEALYEGTRGPGKTEALLVDFAQHVGQGFGPHWRGILFREQYKHLDDVIAKSKNLFYRTFPGAKFLSSRSDYKWIFPDGEELLFRHFDHPDDYWSYHGHEYPWIGWDELTNWGTDECYESMKSCSRSSHPGMPRKYRATANPWGIGHAWVKFYFIDQAPALTPVVDGEGNMRVRIHGDLAENLHLAVADPEYTRRLDGIKNEQLKRAWRYGDWDIVVGGFLQGVWDPDKHKVRPFEIPDDWPRWRALDWGFAAPYSCGWYAIDPDRKIYRYRELYGWGGKPNVGSRETATVVAKKIRDAEAAERARGIEFVRNPADTNIWHSDGREITVGEIFAKQKVRWTPATKGPGSRVDTAQILIETLSQDQFAVFDTCRHWLRTVPVLQPDANNWEDVDTDQEDHCYDETRYSLTSRHQPRPKTRKRKGPKRGSFDWVTRDEPKPRSRLRRH